MTPANDNRTPTAHRAALAAAGTETRRVIAWPTLARMRGNPALARALLEWRDLAHPPAPPPTNTAGEEMDPDSSIAVRPSVNEMFAASARRSFSVERRNGAEVPGTAVRSHSARGRPAVHWRNGVKFYRLGDLRFDAEMKLAAWRDPATGKWGEPTETTRPVRRSRADRALQRVGDARRAEHLLPANDNAPAAAGAGFLGGRVRPAGNAAHGAPMGPVAAEQRIDRERVRTMLSVSAAEILDLALSDATAKQIGERLGYRGPKAGKSGARRVDQALEEFARIISVKAAA